MRSKVPTIVAAVTLAFTLAACGDTGGSASPLSPHSPSTAAPSGQLKFDTGTVSDPTTYLQNLDATWRKSIAGLTAANATIPPDAHCYYALDTASKFTGEMACGPIRRVGADPQHIWDVYSPALQPTQHDNGLPGTAEAVVTDYTLGAASAAYAGDVAPDGTLWRPDGAKPAMSVSAPAYTKAWSNRSPSPSRRPSIAQVAGGARGWDDDV